MDIHSYPTGYPCAYPQPYPIRYPLFIQCILQAYPNWLSTPIQQDIHVHIQFIQWDIHYLSNTFSKHIQLVVLSYPTGYPNISKGISQLSNWISDWISGLICCQGIQAGSCIAIQICILAPGPASPAASDGLPPCSEGKRGVRNACSYPTAGPAALRHPAGPLCFRRHCCLAATNAVQQAAASFRCSRHGFVTLLIHE
jgi:hypothetical protein